MGSRIYKSVKYRLQYCRFMFHEIIGVSLTRLLDFFCDHPNYDYQISELADKTKISRPTIYENLKKLTKNKMVIQTRISGKSRMYKLNTDNDIVRAMLKIDFDRASKVAEKLTEKEAKKRGKT